LRRHVPAAFSVAPPTSDFLYPRLPNDADGLCTYRLLSGRLLWEPELPPNGPLGLAIGASQLFASHALRHARTGCRPFGPFHPEEPCRLHYSTREYTVRANRCSIQLRLGGLDHTPWPTAPEPLYTWV